MTVLLVRHPSTTARFGSLLGALPAAAAVTLFIGALLPARAADPSVTHVVANAWQATDFHNSANPGCSIGGGSSMLGSRLSMGVSKLQADPVSLVIRKFGWTSPAGTKVKVQALFSDGVAVEFAGVGKGQVIDIDLPAMEVRAWTHELTASSSMQLSFGGSEPSWTFDLAGTTTVVNALGECIRSHLIAGVGAPFDLSAASGNAVMSSTQPFGASTPPPEPTSSPVPPSQAVAPARAAPSAYPPSSNAETVIAAWSGSATMQTRPFHADGPWELQWTTTGGYFSARLHRTSNSDSSGQLLANGTEPGSSSYYQPSGGDFFLEFNASHQWTARAVTVVPLGGGAPAEASASPRAALAAQSTAVPTSYPAPGLAQPQSLPQTEKTPMDDAGVPGTEMAFITAIQAARRNYGTAANDMAKGAARPARAREICRVLGSPTVNGWIGTVSKLTTNSEGKGVVSIQIAPDLSLKTWNNSLSDIVDHTMIDPGSSLFQTAIGLKTGQRVRFSAVLIPDQTDCYREGSMTMDGSIAEPEFIMRLLTVRPAGD